MVHEDLVRHPAHIRYRLAAHHDERARERLHVPIALVVPVPHHLVREDRSARKEYMEVEGLPNEIQESIVSPGGLDLDPAVRKQDTAPDGTERGISVQLSHAGLQRAVADLRIGIEKEDVPAARLPSVAILLPARRATRLDPVNTLRAE